MDVSLILSDHTLFLIACLTSLAGAIYDIKTTEIPDFVPLGGFVGALLIYLGRGVVFSQWDDIFIAFATATIFLVLGYALFSTGQWGEADVLILASIGFAVPKPLSFFHPNLMAVNHLLFYPVAFLINCFVVGAIYAILFTLIYALLYAEKKSELLKASFEGMRIKGVVASIPLVMGCTAYLYLSPLNESIAMEMVLVGAKYTAIMFLLFILLNFARHADRNVFMRYISIQKLKEGDVLAEDVKTPTKRFSSKLFVGLTKQDVDFIKKAWKSGKLKTERKGKIKIKEGVRYAPTFFLSLLVTAKYGFIFFYLF